MLLDRQGWRSLLRPALWDAGLVIGAALLAWGEYVKATNLQHFPSWAGSEKLVAFITPGSSRLSLSYIPSGRVQSGVCSAIPRCPICPAGRHAGLSRRSCLLHRSHLALSGYQPVGLLARLGQSRTVPQLLQSAESCAFLRPFRHWGGAGAAMGCDTGCSRLDAVTPPVRWLC